MMGRKPHYGEGSVFERKDGRYEAVVPNFGGTGKRKSFYGKTKTEARKKRDEALKQLARGEYVDVSKMKTGEYLDYWESVHGPTIELVSWQRYKSYIRLYFKPAFGHVPLQKLTTQDIQHMYDALAKEGIKAKKGLKASTLQSIHIPLNGALEYAVRLGKIAKNPCDNVKLPKVKKREYPLLTKEQAHLIIEQSEHRLDDRFVFHSQRQIGAIILLLITTGIRIGEALSLHWSDIDFDKKILLVDTTLSYDTENHVRFEADPKSQSSKREIALSQLAIKALSAHRLNQIEARLEAPEWEDHDLVFTNKKGGHTWDSLVRTQLKSFLGHFGLPDIKPHDLRHNVSTALIAAGTPMKTVQALLGHTKIATTMDLYGHVSPEMKQSAADDIDQIFGG